MKRLIFVNIFFQAWWGLDSDPFRSDFGQSSICEDQLCHVNQCPSSKVSQHIFHELSKAEGDLNHESEAVVTLQPVQGWRVIEVVGLQAAHVSTFMLTLKTLAFIIYIVNARFNWLY